MSAQLEDPKDYVRDKSSWRNSIYLATVNTNLMAHDQLINYTQNIALEN